jgi:glutamine synthetase
MRTSVETPRARLKNHEPHPENELAEGIPPTNKLELLIGKPSGEWMADDLLDLCRDRDIRMISLMHVGGDGWLKTLDFVPRDELHFRDVIGGGERADGSSLFANSGILVGKSDILLRPRIESAFLDPFAELPVMVLMCRHADREGHPLPESPDTIIHRAYDRVQKLTGVELYAHGEVEFYVGKRPDETDVYGANDHGYHASSPFVFAESLRREALLTLAEMGVPIKYGHAEVGYISPGAQNERLWEQHEIELALQPLPQAAESVVLTQWVLRNLAAQRGFKCSFAPVLLKGHAGNGMHFHLAPFQNHDFVSPFVSEDKFSNPARWLIGGLVRFGGMLMAFGNRADTSFLRLSQAKEAPNAVTWGQFNRKALVRLPIVAKDDSGKQIAVPTIEFRLPDGSAHPHLLLAGIAQAMCAAYGMNDVDQWIECTKENSETRPDAPAIPTSIEEIQAAVRTERAMLEADSVFPTELINQLIAPF